MSVQSNESQSASEQPSAAHADDPSNTPANTIDAANEQAGDELDTRRAALAEITQKADEYLRLAQRTQADFINYRRRVDDERAQQARDANVTFLLRILPILDDFERALANAEPEQLESNWGRGIQLVERNLRSLLAADEVQRIAPEGAEFDPREHEALGSQPSADVPEGHVLHVIRPGYRKGEKVLRPAQVVIAARPD